MTRNRPPGRLVAARSRSWLLPGIPPPRTINARAPTDDDELLEMGRRRPVLALAATGVVLVLGLVACTVGIGFSVVDDTPNDPEVRVMWFLSWAFPDVGEKGPWRRNVCGDATDRIGAVIDTEDRRLHDQFAPDWIASHAWNPDYRSTENKKRATVTVEGRLEIHRADESGFNPYSVPDRTWTFTLRRNWMREWVWCIDHLETRPA
ncbi:hypothetical protein [Cryptosporangium arvum]|uniref:Uncharacterized protein n=1 Tax=Cryptosporangium arvum DSM 44712 TaxID=927661 RepID=A0A010YJ97_9ACTN|nr:hypothetical protein [Cryptosporangium arvum]EXG80275.1 hypothetical protein CryarDRAFT_1341 [Cryptosporangium arvum DSM 44712]